MSMTTSRPTAVWTTISDALDIPQSLYRKAADRHVSVGNFLCRDGSSVAFLNPAVRPQGSFRYGTVIRPLDAVDDYDLDHVVVLHGINPSRTSQRDVKHMLGRELKLYAQQFGMNAPTEHNRCWRLNYRDEVGFHLDSLPCIPADSGFITGLHQRGVDPRWADVAVAITDLKHPSYEMPRPGWRESNPRGFARWFESRAAQGREITISKDARAGTVEDVPTFAWRTPLQRSIQIMKRHRDVMFRSNPTLKPISMIITNTAAWAYNGERDLVAALRNIVAGMPSHVRNVAPFVPNPTHPSEDYADKWNADPQLRDNFFYWHEQITAVVDRLSRPLERIEPRYVRDHFAVELTDAQVSALEVRAPTVHVPAALKQAASIPVISSGPKPWGR